MGCVTGASVSTTVPAEWLVSVANVSISAATLKSSVLTHRYDRLLIVLPENRLQPAAIATSCGAD